MQFAQTMITFAWGYGAVGAAVSALFLLFGIDRIDPAAKGTYSFRPLLIPGIVVLWPFVLVRWLSLERSVSRPTAGQEH